MSAYLDGPFAPVSTEHAPLDVTPDGGVPRDSAGTYLRNGPNPRFAAPGAHHWFDGDGMLHGLTFDDGQVRYANRYVQAAGYRRESDAGQALWRGLLEPTTHNVPGMPYKDTANTDVVVHNGEALALWYVCGMPVRVDPTTLQTLGPAAFMAERGGVVSAHAKVDTATDELLFFEYGPEPWLRHGVVDASGALTHDQRIALPGPRLPHDMAITERYSVLMDLPVYHRPEAAKKRRWIIDYHRDEPARFCVLPRHGRADAARWFEAAPCYIYHVVNAWEDGDDAITMIACRTTDPLPTPNPADGDPLTATMMANLRLRATLHRYRFDLRTGQTHEEAMGDDIVEFPAVDQRLTGRRSRSSWVMAIADARTLLFEGIVKVDLQTGATRRVDFGEHCVGSEVAFAPRAGSDAEDDGYLVTFVSDLRQATSEARLYDAADLSLVRRIPLPVRVPLGFHACWAPAS